MNLTDTYPRKYTAYFTAVHPIDFIVSPTIFANYIFVIRMLYYKRENRIVLSPSYLRIWWIRANVSTLIHGNFALFDCFVVHTVIVTCLIPLAIIVPVYLSSFNVTFASCNYFPPILCSTFHIKYGMCFTYATSMKRTQKMYFCILIYLRIHYLYIFLRQILFFVQHKVRLSQGFF